MATIGNVVVKVLADMTRFVSNMRRSQRAVGRFRGSVSLATATIKRFGKAAAVGITAGGIFGIFQQGRLIGNIVDTADKLGITADALVRLQFAANATGVATNILDLGLQRMGRRVAEAAKGLGEARLALKTLGLDAKALAQLPIDKQFLDIAEAMKLVDNRNERLRLGFKLFDSEGVTLVNTLALQKKGIIELGKEADKLGLTFGEPGSARLRKAQLEATRLKGRAAGAARSIFLEGAPVIGQINRGVESSLDFTERILLDALKRLGSLDRAGRSPGQTGEQILVESLKHLGSIDRKMDNLGAVTR